MEASNKDFKAVETSDLAASSAQSLTSLSLIAPAKINLFLHINGRRADGYHQLQTVFRLLDWGDHLHFSRQADTKISLGDSFINDDDFSETTAVATDLAPVDCDWIVASGLLKLRTSDTITANPADNLIIKAAHTLLNELSQQQQLPAWLNPITISVDKQIPMGAGLGGGSSNAASTLMALNQLWGLQLTQQQLLRIGTRVGADVPIFIFQQDAIGEGIGEQLTPITLPPQRYLLLFPQAHISTAELFAHPDLQRDCPALATDTITQQQQHYLSALLSPYQNVFQPVVTDLSLEVQQALQFLQQLAERLGSLPSPVATQAPLLTEALCPRLTGSGSTVFLPLPSILCDEMLTSLLADAPCPGQLVASANINNFQVKSCLS